MKKFCFFLFLFLFSTKVVFAADKNIFGLHLTQFSDINSAKDIINSQGGDWGWVTIIARPDQLNHQAWQEFFDNCRKYHLIPIVRLATIVDQSNWKQPSLSDIDNLANFLDSLNWPTTSRHIVLFNEINHAAEWGGIIDIKNYVDVAIYAANKFKSLNSNYFIMGSGLDLASPDKAPQFKSAGSVYQEINAYKPEYFQVIDGIASHSYPNHGFVGTPSDTGQHSIHGYQWELNYLKSLGVSKTYPVFITETGWPHREGEKPQNNFYTTDTTAKFLLAALKIWGQDDRVQAVTPFIYNYPNEPFDHFSWVDKDEKLFPKYQQIVDSPKNKNHPDQETKYELVGNDLPFIIFTGNEYFGQVTLKNTGQSVWGEAMFCLSPQATTNVTLESICTSNNLIFPGQSETFNYKFKINQTENAQSSTYLSWENLPKLNVAPLNGSATIYSPKNNFPNNIINFIRGLFI